MTTLVWHNSHELNPPSPVKLCLKCVISDHHIDYEKYIEAECKPSGYFFKGRNEPNKPLHLMGKVILPRPDFTTVQHLAKFYTQAWCGCGNTNFSLGYSLARYQWSGLFCIACDTENVTGKEHCHCGACGGICQVG